MKTTTTTKVKQHEIDMIKNKTKTTAYENSVLQPSPMVKTI